ncbi:UPF0575 protein C19orf67 like [Dissostichus eleginoides]|uniref:UPF0575 protein C19orf67 like n=1 Tax=Dissostichus eleginoides TaxID=100907 RepID=A0AAD9BQ98_DISEL|nr:UPF0575 protein C19orf67 like [Dissostichus eleginoides]
MGDVEVEVQVPSDSPTEEHECGGLQEDMSGEKQSDYPETPEDTRHGEEEEPWLPVALAPPCGEPAACSCAEVRWMERSLQAIKLQLQFLMSKADDLDDCLVNGQGLLEREALAAAVPRFLYSCQPYFNYLESTSIVSQRSPLHFDIYTRQLCDRLEQLVLTFASYNLFSLDETEPNSVSHFCIGQSQLGPLKVTTFRYCRPTQYLAQVDTGLFKRMRWNVERLPDEHYFLCYEDIPNAHAETGGDSQGVSDGDVVRMWSIGQWVQATPETDDICEWILCQVPTASYHRLLFLGSNEPSSCSATDYLQQLLLCVKLQRDRLPAAAAVVCQAAARQTTCSSCCCMSSCSVTDYLQQLLLSHQTAE